MAGSSSKKVPSRTARAVSKKSPKPVRLGLITIRSGNPNDLDGDECEIDEAVRHTSLEAALGYALVTSKPRSIVAIHARSCGLLHGEDHCTYDGCRELVTGARA